MADIRFLIINRFFIFFDHAPEAGEPAFIAKVLFQAFLPCLQVPVRHLSRFRQQCLYFTGFLPFEIVTLQHMTLSVGKNNGFFVQQCPLKYRDKRYSQVGTIAAERYSFHIVSS